MRYKIMMVWKFQRKYREIKRDIPDMDTLATPIWKKDNPRLFRWVDLLNRIYWLFH